MPGTGSFCRRSVSLMILFGSGAVMTCANWSRTRRVTRELRASSCPPAPLRKLFNGRDSGRLRLRCRGDGRELVLMVDASICSTVKLSVQVGV